MSTLPQLRLCAGFRRDSVVPVHGFKTQGKVERRGLPLRRVELDGLLHFPGAHTTRNALIAVAFSR